MTTGLDPAARRIAWDLIRTIRERGATVVLVTHFMDEAEYLCDRVAVVNKGRTVAIDSPHGLVSTHAEVIKVTFSSEEADFAWLNEVAEVDTVVRRGPRVEAEGRGPVLATVAHALVERGIRPPDLHATQPTLEDVYLKLTDRSAED
jgi:ABC-2 type transport system ATP-binding protein